MNLLSLRKLNKRALQSNEERLQGVVRSATQALHAEHTTQEVDIRVLYYCVPKIARIWQSQCHASSRCLSRGRSPHWPAFGYNLRPTWRREQAHAEILDFIPLPGAGIYS